MNHQYVLYGIKNYMEVIEKIIKDMKLDKYSFDIKIILTEALSNAYKHGNNNDASKPIYLKAKQENSIVRFSIEDSSEKYHVLKQPLNIDDNNLLDDGGRGLYIIKFYADKVFVNKNAIIIEKNIV